MFFCSTSTLKQLRPSLPRRTPSQMSRCERASTNQEAMLFTSLYLVALGNGAIKAALPSLGADQFDERDPKEAASLPSYFNWYYFFINIGAIVGLTFIVWINTNTGWDWAFGVCSMAIVIGLVALTVGRSGFRHNVPKGSPLTRILQVFVAAIRNRNLTLPDRTEELHEVHDKEAEHIEILQRNHAAIVTHSQDTTTSPTTHGSWNTCTVTQVEETKILVRMIPIILSTVFLNTCLAQLQTFTIQQSTTTNRKIGTFEIPASSIGVIPLLFLFILIPLYDRVFVPLVREFTKKPTGITQLQRIGVGLVFSAISMAVSGMIETRRKNVAREHGLVDSVGPLPMSVFWLAIQDLIFAVAHIFALVGLLDFFYAESSAGMKSLGTAISWCSFAFGYFGSTVVVEVVNKLSGGWLANNNLNRDRLEYFYWLLAGLSVVNFGVYLLSASWYKYKKVQVKLVGNGRIGCVEETEMEMM
ncbi:protein nrt1/ ptr family 4.5 [Phtheirospermum japonicum]|uniref:Protein nrt1/ ptr family 4.5 n=1 Tax=Phtheirospermum japonicum TaxID=374723 RepID=A0A830D826_9LAMI|nr:protein nrt1/ ptr family 4.5 [Phtheirospermum japonicum]